MCIIVYKPTGVKIPSKKILHTCWDNNSDGAGYMFNFNNRVIIKKGFMTFNKFYKSLNSDYKKYDGDNKTFIMHFRISTQGGVNKECTHPFPLSKEMSDLRKLQCTTDIGIAHNGIISLTSVGYNKQVTYSDTMSFITDYLSLIIKDRNYYKDPDTISLISKLVDSKLAIMDGSGTTTLIGTFIEDNGCYYSNASYNVYPKYYSQYDDDNWYPQYKDGLSYIEHYRMIDEMFGAYTDEEIDAMPSYNFTPCYCPCTEYGVDSYCDKCVSRSHCWGDKDKEEEV